MNDPSQTRGLMLYPTHENCAEAEEAFTAKGISACAYGGRFSSGEDQNCWNPNADICEKLGLSVAAAICPLCDHRQACLQNGYLSNLDAARSAQVSIATHARASHTGIKALAAGRQYVAIHENAVSLLRPSAYATETDLVNAAMLLTTVLNSPRYLDWFGQTCRYDEDGVAVPDEKLAARREALFQFTTHLANVADSLVGLMANATKTQEWIPPPKLDKAVGIEGLLFRVTDQSPVKFLGSLWRVLLGAATGELFSAGIVVDTPKGKGGEQQFVRRLVAVWNNLPCVQETTVWLCDATVDLKTLEEIVGQRVTDGTPRGRLALRHKVVQIPRDITRTTSTKVVQGVLRGVLADRPHIVKAGIICHQPHVAAVNAIGSPFAERIAKVAYFGSGEDRSSNAWHTACDAVLVIGTPRLPPGAIRGYLFQIGNVGAACRDPEWLPYFWQGKTESGEVVRVKAKGYPNDDDWRRAHRNLCRAAIVQAIGRGRGILDNGIEVVLVSTEEAGAVLSDAESETVGNLASKILNVMERASAENSKERFSLENSALTAVAIACSLEMSVRRVQEVLAHLEGRGLVAKIGERKGWRLVTQAAEA